MLILEMVQGKNRILIGSNRLKIYFFLMLGNYTDFKQCIFKTNSFLSYNKKNYFYY